MTKEEIGRILKELRIASGKTQKEVAEKIGRKQQVIGHWETGYSQPDANTLFILCDLYNANINEAFGFSNKEWIISSHEKNVLSAYRANPDMQAAVDRLLGVDNSIKKSVENKKMQIIQQELESADELIMDVSGYDANKLTKNKR